MNFAIVLCALLAPIIACLAAAATLATTFGSRDSARLAIYAAVAGLVASTLAAAGVALAGAARTPLLGADGIGLSIHIDALAAIMLVLVSFVGLAVVRYSRNYLDGDPGHKRFTRWLLLTLAAVELLLIAGNLALLVVAWIATSLSLNKLLLFYAERPAAQRAARKKFLASRIGDLSLIVAAALLYGLFGTLEIPDLVAAARSGGIADASWSLTVAALLIVVTATLKSAQLPLHGWLIEVMETPTPVSALLHAGIIDAGGFLVLRLADVLLLATSALEVLAVVGGVTALFGSLVMLTQTSIKVQLAYSTVAQMGFMLLQCGLGAFSSALLHIVAHSLYKAHAFLSSGGVMDLARASWTPSPSGQPHPLRLVVSIIAVIALALGVAWTFGFTPYTNPAQIALGCILLMGLVHLMANAIDERPNAFVIARTALTAAGVAVLYFALQTGMERIAASSLPVGHRAGGPVDMLIAAVVVLCFAAVTIFQNAMMRRADAPFWVAAYVHLKSGLYLNTLANRLVLEYWPRRSSAAVANAGPIPQESPNS
jgi:NAD(P)H-quinone oxidoreductase subunit 5